LKSTGRRTGAFYYTNKVECSFLGFFDGWRQKVGCVLLVIAALFSSAWVRSLVIRDIFTWTFVDAKIGVVAKSHKGTIGWLRISPAFSKQDDGWKFDNDFRGNVFDTWIDLDGVADHLKRRWQWVEFDFGAASWVDETMAPDDHNSIIVFIVPYWSIVLPVTLLSAYLIFWPGKRKAALLPCVEEKRGH